MTDKELVEKIRNILDTNYKVETKGIMNLMIHHANTLDDIEQLLTANNYPAERTTEFVKS